MNRPRQLLPQLIKEISSCASFFSSSSSFGPSLLDGPSRHELELIGNLSQRPVDLEIWSLVVGRLTERTLANLWRGWMDEPKTIIKLKERWADTMVCLSYA